MIIRPFNVPFIIMLLIFAGTFAFLTVLARKRGVDYARKLLGWVSAALVPILVVHLVSNITDPVLRNTMITNGILPHTIWSVLPFHLCYMNVLLTPAAIFSDNRHLEHFCAVTGPMGGLASLCMPGVGYSDTGLFAPCVMTYYLFHMGIVFCGISIFTFKLLRPTYRDIPWTFLILIILGAAVHIVNLVLVQTGLCPNANYFFTITPTNLPLKLAYSVIPVSFLYMIPVGIILFGVYIFPLTAIMNAVGGRRRTADDGGGQK